MKKKILGILMIVLVFGFGVSTRAGAAEEAKSPLSFDAGIDITSDYYFRGFLQQNEGLIAQPYADAYLKVFESGNTSLTLWAGVWNSFHGKKPAAADSPEHWYEFDFLGGAELAMGPVTAGVTYIYYNSPADLFGDIHEIEVKLSFDDSGLVKGTMFPALNPYIAVAFEVEDENAGATEDTYMQIGIEPSFEGKVGNLPITVAFPVAFGFSLDDYYTDKNGKEDTLGYISTGISVSTPLPLPGSWTLTASITHLYLDSFSVRTLNGGSTTEVIGTIGVSTEF